MELQFALGSVTEYDQIKIGGKTYSVNQIIGKTIIAAIDTRIFSNPYGAGTVLGTIKSGQPIGVVYSYLMPHQTDGRTWLMFDDGRKTFFVPNEAASGSGLKEQGTLTVEQEIKFEKEVKLKNTEPVLYYMKKIGIPAALIVGGIILLKEIAPIFIEKSFTKKKSLAHGPE